LHKADINSKLAKKGYTLIGFADKHGLSRDSVSETLRTGRPKIEKLLADELNTTPQKLFPKRFHPDGRRRDARIDRAVKRKSLMSDNNTKGVVAASAKKAGVV